MQANLSVSKPLFGTSLLGPVVQNELYAWTAHLATDWSILASQIWKFVLEPLSQLYNKEGTDEHMKSLHLNHYNAMFRGVNVKSFPMHF